MKKSLLLCIYYLTVTLTVVLLWGMRNIAEAIRETKE